jgi:hypothetical protein
MRVRSLEHPATCARAAEPRDWLARMRGGAPDGIALGPARERRCAERAEKVEDHLAGAVGGERMLGNAVAQRRPLDHALARR